MKTFLPGSGSYRPPAPLFRHATLRHDAPLQGTVTWRHLLSATALAILLSACGGGSGDSAPPSAAARPADTDSVAERSSISGSTANETAGTSTESSGSTSGDSANDSAASGASASDRPNQSVAVAGTSNPEAAPPPPPRPEANDTQAQPESGSQATSNGAESDTETAPEPDTKTFEPETSEPAESSPANGDSNTGDSEELTASTDKEISGSQAKRSSLPDGGTDGNDSVAELEGEPDTSEPAEIDFTDNSVDSTPSTIETYFVSNNTPGFTGEVLPDRTVVVSWMEYPDSRGYNVYRASEYLTTVFTNEFRDLNLPEGSYYYEIEAFSHDDVFTRMARGLTVDIGDMKARRAARSTLPAMLSDDYQMVFSDEFNGGSLDESKWNTRFLWGTDKIINYEDQYYVNTREDRDFGYNPFLFDGENLTIRAIPTPDHLKAKANNQPYLSGLLTSYDAFKFTYGYAETRARMPYGRGLWPAFWLLNAYYNDRRPEIDIVEFIGHDQDAAYHTYHYFDYEDNLRSTKFPATVAIDFTNDFHTYGALWKPGEIVFYVDGIERQRVTDPNVSHEEMYVLLNLALGGWWAGPPTVETEFPADYVIDYVRVYQGNQQLQDAPQFDAAGPVIPLASEELSTSPNHMPSREAWPEGYPY